MATTVTRNIGSHNALTVTNLNGLISNSTSGWQSARIDDVSATKALDYEISAKLVMTSTAPANDKAVYVYVVPWYYDGSSWYANDQGTATLPSGSEGPTLIASPNDMRLLGVLSYTTQGMTLQGTFLLSNAVGQYMPDGWSLVINNYSGAAVSGSNNMVAYKIIKEDLTTS